MDPSTDPGSFPDLPIEPFLILMALGFLIGGAGHLFGVRLLVGLGVVLIAAATIVVPAILYLAR
jgi:hypothetical protein